MLPPVTLLLAAAMVALLAQAGTVVVGLLFVPRAQSSLQAQDPANPVTGEDASLRWGRWRVDERVRG